MKFQVLTGLALLGLTICMNSCCNATCGDQDSKVYVESEFAPLKRVVLTVSEVHVTDKCTREFFEEGVDTSAFLAGMRKEREDLKAVLEKYGVEIQRPRLFTEEEIRLGYAKDGYCAGEGVTNHFSRDPFVTIGNHIIELSFRSPRRRLEVLPIRHILEKEAEESGCYYVGMPQLDVSEGLESDRGPYLEGGDILVYHKKVFVGHSGRASSSKGITWLRNYLKHFGYEVIEVPLVKTTLHLDCAMSLVREGLMVVCPDALPAGIPEEFKDWDKIEVSYEEAQNLATNGLPIDEKTYITDIAFKDTVGKELEKRGITVEYVAFANSRHIEGAFRCSTQPLLRK